MSIDADHWLSTTLGRPAFVLRLAADRPIAPAIAEVRRHAAQQRGGFYFAKLGSLDLERVAALGEAGFRVVETNLAFAAPMERSRGDDVAHGIAFERFEPRWRDAVLAIAASCFRYSRFHVDPAFPRPVADHVKREWIRSYVEGRRGDCLLVAHDRGTPVGFAAMMTAEHATARTAIIDLIGVATDAQRRGIGRGLVRRAFDEYTGRCSTLEVGTQASNIPSVRLYEGMGLRLTGSGFVLHHHAAG
jgi:ribosomal protein S18 acetylase RimI-like enzyme